MTFFLLKIDRSSKDAELKASVDSVLMQLEREVAHHSQQSASEPENNSKDKKKKKKKVKKKKITKATKIKGKKNIKKILETV